MSISGSWLSEACFNSIIESKSPRKSQDGSHYIVIPGKTLQQTTMIYNFHEGGASLVILKNNEHYEFWWMQDDRFAQKVYEVKIISQSKICIGDKVFVKISSSTDTDNYKVLEDILFKGIYTDTDKNRIEFTGNGQIIGLDDFHFYDPIVDYYDEGMQVDQILLGNSKNDRDYFGFKFQGDTLELYMLNCVEHGNDSNDCEIVEYGQLIHKLWRQK